MIPSKRLGVRIDIPDETDPDHNYHRRTQARELIEAGRVSRIYEEETVWKDIIRTNVLFNFVQ